MEHYICTGGCKGQSDKQGTCQAMDCPKHGHELEKCDCEDSQHHGAWDFEHEHEKSLPEKVELDHSDQLAGRLPCREELEKP